jgi:hypothetical protein
MKVMTMGITSSRRLSASILRIMRGRCVREERSGGSAWCAFVA